MTREHAKLILEDLENKKHYNAKWDFACDGCGEQVFQGDALVFMGDKKKVCITCLAAMQDDLQGAV